MATCVALAGGFIACNESSVVPPLAPSPLNPEKVGELTIACPADVLVQSQDGQAVPISYPAPVIQGGEAPVVSSCTPESGSAFPIGTTEGRCTTSDSLGQAASCTFTQVVLAPPMLAVTNILAFGDSLTAGVVSLAIRAIGQLEPQNSYPTRLEDGLGQAYRVQTITVANEGLPGERATNAASRLQSALVMHNPEVVLLMEGTNDLGHPVATVETALAGMQTMLGLVAGAGAAAVVGTIPPIRPLPNLVDTAAEVAPYNDGLRALAAARGVRLVDLYEVINNGNCPTRPLDGLGATRDFHRGLLVDIRGIHQSITCIGDDHIHPTAEGYQLMADAFFDHIVATYDIPVSPVRVGGGSGRVRHPAGPASAAARRD